MTQPIVKETVELYPERCELPRLNYIITKFSVRAVPSELKTIVALFLNDVLAASHTIEADATATKAATYSVNTRFGLEPQDRVTYEITVVPPWAPTISVTKYPTVPYPNWQTWQIGGQVPQWFSVGASIKLVAGANPSVVVRGIVSAWDEVPKKFRIDLVELGGDATPHNSWFMSLDGEGKTAAVSKISVNCEYTKRITKWRSIAEEDENIPVTAPPEAAVLRPKKRRIMM